MMKPFMTAACALALGVAWTMAPAVAADDTAKDKMKRAEEKAETKIDTAVDKTKEKTGETKDELRNKMTGSKGSDTVRHAQQALMDRGISPGPIDGKMGPQTKAALREFQQKENLKVTGRLDSETKHRLIPSVSSKMDMSAPAASPSTQTDTSASTAPPTGPAADQNKNLKKKQAQ